MKIYPGNLLMKAMGLSSEDKGKFYEAVFHLWPEVSLSEDELVARIGTISDSLKNRFKVNDDGEYYLPWLDADRAIQTAVATKNSSNRKGRKKVATGSAIGLTTGITTGESTLVPIPVPNAIPKPKKKERASEPEVPLVITWPEWAGPKTLEKWEEFKAYRLERHKLKYKSPKTEQRAISLLGQYFDCGQDCVAAMDKAMGREWIFPVDPRETKAKFAKADEQE